MTDTTRLHPFACSWLYNATAVRGTLWWFCQSHSVNYVVPFGDYESYRKLRKSSTFAIRQAAARLSPSGSTTFQTTFSPVSFGKSFMKICSAVPENGCLIFLTDGKKTKNKKNICKTYTHPPPTGRQLRKWWIRQISCMLLQCKCWHLMNDSYRPRSPSLRPTDHQQNCKTLRLKILSAS